MDSNLPQCQSQEKISSQYLWQQAPLVAEPSHRPKDSLLPGILGVYCFMKQKEKEEAVAFHDP